MELEDLQAYWDKLGTTPSAKKWPPKDVRRMIKSRMRTTLLKALLPELFIASVGWYFVLLTLTQFSLLDSLVLRLLGISFVVTWGFISGYRIFLLLKLYKLRNLTAPPQQTYQEVLQNRLKFEQVQLITPAVWAMQVIAIGVLLVKIYNEYDVTTTSTFWLIVVVLAWILFGWYRLKVKPYYSDKIAQVEQLLKDICQ